MSYSVDASYNNNYFTSKYTSAKNKIRTLYNKSVDLFKTSAKYTILKTGALTKYFGSSAGDFLSLSLMEKDEREFTIKNSGGKILSPGETKEKFKEMGIDKNRYIKQENQNLQTYVFSSDSKIAKQLNSNALLQQNVKEIINSNAPDNYVGTFNSANCDNKDIYLSLGQAKIIGLHKTDDGYIEGFIEDVYNFDEQYGKTEKEDPSFYAKFSAYVTDKANGAAVDLQNKGILKNYRVLIPIRIKAQ